MKRSFETLAYVLSHPFYLLISVVTAIGMGFLYYYFTLSTVPATAAEITGTVFLTVSFGLTFATAALAGVSISLIVFKIRAAHLINIRGSGGSTAFGGTLTAFVPGCPGCTTPLVAVLSSVGGLTVFPLFGLELKIISVTVLIFSIAWTLRGLVSCKVVKR